VIAALLAAFGAVFLAELPDKTMFATLVLTTRYPRPLAVWTGAVVAFTGHVLLAVSVGSFLRQLPKAPVQAGVGLLFLVGAFLLWREEDDDDHEHGVDVEVDAAVAAQVTFLGVATRSAAVLGLAEFGDITQLATAGIAGSTGEPVGVAIGSLAALASVAALAVLAGSRIERRVPLRIVRRVAAVLFAAFGVVAILVAIT
jgi:putative Ca2+/H+ antiporter (TMEM165/GDT1 family)